MLEKSILRVPDVCKLLSISQPSLFRWRRIGIFPQPVKYGPNTVGWERQTVEDWLKAKKSAGQAAQ